MAECSVDAVLGDPPYGLEFMGIEFDSRTEHRLVCGIEDAGFGIRDKIYWHFGSGFPKSTDIAKQLDKRAGAEREVVSEGAGYEAAPDRATYGHGLNVGFLPRQVTAPATPEAKRWDGWGTALKPATETVVIAMKPLDGTFAENALRWKVAGLNIDGGRIPSSGEHMRGFVAGMTAGGMTAGDTRTGKSLGRFEAGRAFQATDHPSGRWPANLVLVHSPGCVRRGKEKVKGHKHSGKPGHGKDGQVYGRGIVFGGDTQCYADPDGLEEVEEWSCVEGCPVLELARQSGERPSGAIRKEVQAAKFGTHGIYGEGKEHLTAPLPASTTVPRPTDENVVWASWNACHAAGRPAGAVNRTSRASGPGGRSTAIRRSSLSNFASIWRRCSCPRSVRRPAESSCLSPAVVPK